MIDSRWIRHKYYRADLFKYSTTSFLIRHFFGYNGHQANAQSGNLGYGFLHYAFITALKPERILCIGSEQGFIPAICAMACKDTGHGHVDFVDAGKNFDEDNSWGGIGFWKQHDPRTHFSGLDLNKWISVHVMTSKKFAKKYHYKYEYIFIDGDHSYEGVKFDYNTFWPRLASRGIMGFHDITLRGLHNQNEFGVWKLWEELKDKNKIYFVALDNSVGFIQK